MNTDDIKKPVETDAPTPPPVPLTDEQLKVSGGYYPRPGRTEHQKSKL